MGDKLREKECVSTKAELVELLRDMEFCQENGIATCCPECAGTRNTGHRALCRLGKALQATSPRRGGDFERGLGIDG